MTDQLQYVPVLLIIFRRPHTTRRVLEVLGQVQPSRLYVAADGPRPGNLEEAKLSAQARAIATSPNWPCTVSTFFRDTNVGCRRAVSEAISWFFQQESMGIVLEDDCLPDPSFFRYCSELLHRYADDERIFQISGNNFQSGIQRTDRSYYFSRYNHIWGWASWRRAWDKYDQSLAKWPTAKARRLLHHVGNGSAPFERHWERIIQSVYDGKTDSWAYVWTFSCWAEGGLTVIPNANLVENIGFDVGSSHTPATAKARSRLPGRHSMHFPLSHPDFIVQNLIADRYTDRHHFGIRGLFGTALRRLAAPIRSLLRIAKVALFRGRQ